MSTKGTPGASSLVAYLGALVGAAVVTALATVLALVLIDRYDRPAVDLSRPELPTIVVQIGGAVATPGVYTLPPGARLNDAILEAGGLRPDADPASLNLAARIGDGETIVVDSRRPATPVAERREDPDGPLNVNTATAAELETLPGIGPVLGERIVAYRDLNGPFATLEELTEIDGISDGLLDDLRPHITLDD